MRRDCLEPVVDAGTRLLVLGSMPGNESLRLGQYYANPSNQFWRIMYALFKERPAQPYADRIAFLQSKGVGLWDVFKHCTREGSSDAAIDDEELNDFGGLARRCKELRCIAFNGGKADKAFPREKFERTGWAFVSLPSTSAAPGRYVKSVDEKLRLWGAILKFLQTRPGRARHGGYDG